MRLDETHYRGLEMLLRGKAHADVAEELGIAITDIHSWFQDAGFLSELDRLREQLQLQCKEVVVSNLRDHAPVALAQIITLAQGAKSERIKLTASQDLLDRAGFGAVQKIQAAVEMHFPPGTLELAQRVLEEMNARTITVSPQGHSTEEPVLLQ